MSASLFFSMIQRGAGGGGGGATAFPNATTYMTGYTAPSGYQAGTWTAVSNTFVASGGAGYSGNAAWKAYDNGNLGDYYNAAGASVSSVGGTGTYFAVNFPSGRVYTGLDVYAAQDSSYWYHIQKFLIVGSNSGTSWTTLSTVDRTTTPWGAVQKNQFLFSNSTSYTYYGIKVTDGGYTNKSTQAYVADGSALIRQLVWQP